MFVVALIIFAIIYYLNNRDSKIDTLNSASASMETANDIVINEVIAPDSGTVVEALEKDVLEPMAKVYLPCSATITDNCVQTQ